MNAIDLYADLYRQEATRQQLSSRQLAAKLKAHHSGICSFLKARSIPKQDRLDEIAEALGIDHVRAFLAVEIFESVEAYNEPATKLLALFIPWLADTLSSDDCQLEDDLRDWEANSLFEKIRHLIVELLGPRSRFKQPFLSFRGAR